MINQGIRSLVKKGDFTEVSKQDLEDLVRRYEHLLGKAEYSLIRIYCLSDQPNNYYANIDIDMKLIRDDAADALKEMGSLRDRED